MPESTPITKEEKQPLSPAMLRALRGIRDCAGEGGWATMWPGDVTPGALRRCEVAGLLEHSVRTATGCNNIGFSAYRLTPTAHAALKPQEGAVSGKEP